MTMQTRSQKYAQIVYEQIKEVKDSSSCKKEDYANLCKKLAPMILTNGLMQAVMFLSANIEKHPDRGLLRKHLLSIIEINDNATDLIESDVSKYMMLTEKALEAANWYKRFAEAQLENEKDKPVASDETQNEGKSHEK